MAELNFMPGICIGSSNLRGAGPATIVVFLDPDVEVLIRLSTARSILGCCDANVQLLMQSCDKFCDSGVQS